MIRIIFLLIIIFSTSYPQDGMTIAKMVDERKAPQDIVSKTTMLLTNSKGTVSYTHLTLPTIYSV